MSDSKYDDIIGLPHYEPKYHPRMPIENRAAQFAPFAALTGHAAAIAETARLTDRPPELSDGQQIELSRKLTYALERHSTVSITYFHPDSRKAGGRYVNITGVIKKIDDVERTIILTNGSILSMDRVTDLRGEIFDTFE